MATYEHISLTQYKDENGDMHIIYPIVKKDCIEGDGVKTITLSSKGWSDSAPYTQTVSIDGINEDDILEAYLYYPDSIDSTNVEDYVESFNYVHKIETGQNLIVATAFSEKPTIDLNIVLKRW